MNSYSHHIACLLTRYYYKLVSDQYKLIQNILHEIKVYIVDIQNQIQYQGLLLRLNNGNVDDSIKFETVSELDEFELNLKVDELNESRLVNI